MMMGGTTPVNPERHRSPSAMDDVAVTIQAFHNGKRLTYRSVLSVADFLSIVASAQQSNIVKETTR